MDRTVDYVRASRYRRLALVEKDKANADLLRRLAQEAEQGILCTTDRPRQPSSPRHSPSPASRSNGSLKSSHESVLPW